MNIAKHGLPVIFKCCKVQKEVYNHSRLAYHYISFYIDEISKKQEVIDLPTANIGSTSYLHLSNPNVSDLQYLAWFSISLVWHFHEESGLWRWSLVFWAHFLSLTQLTYSLTPIAHSKENVMQQESKIVIGILFNCCFSLFWRIEKIHSSFAITFTFISNIIHKYIDISKWYQRDSKGNSNLRWCIVKDL